MSVNVGKAIAYLDLDTTGFKRGMTEAQSSLQSFSNTSLSLADKLQSFGSALSTSGTALTKSVTVPLVALGTAATTTAASFESSMSKVEAVSGATSQEMEQLTSKAIEMGAKTKFSAKESADAFTYMAMAGWDAGQMIDGISGIMSLAAADGLDLATTSDIVTDALTAFGLQASDSAHFADVLAQASSSANTNVSMLGESFKYIAPVAGSLGMSVEDTALALGLMANAGIKGTQSGTALRTALTNLVKPTDNMAAKIEELGIEVTNSDGTMKSLKDIMDILRDKFGTLSEAEQANAAATIFGKEAMSGMLAIINTSQSDYDKLANSIANADGRAQDMADTMMDNLSGAITLLKSALESLAIKIGTALTPVVREIAEWITKLVEYLNTLSDEQIQQIVKIAVIVAAIGPLLLIIGKLITFITGVISAVMQIASVVKSFMSLGSLLFAGVKAIAAFITGTLIPAIAAIGAPVWIIIGVITALIAIGVALYKNWEEISTWASKVWEDIKQTVSNAIESIGKFFNNLRESVSSTVESIGSTLQSLWQSIMDFFTGLAKSVSEWISSIFQSLNNLIAKLSEFGSKITEMFGKFIQSVSEFFVKLFDSVKQSLSSIVSSVIEWGSTMVSKAVEIGTNFVKTFTNAFTNLVASVMSIINQLVGAISNWGSTILKEAVKIGTSFTSAIVDNVKKVGTFFADVFDDIISTITSLLPKMVQAGKDVINKLWEGMKSVFTSVADWIKETLGNIFDPIFDYFDKLFSPIKDLFGNVTSLFSGSHANGLDYVPYNGYVAQLHEGERVLTKQENQDYRNGKGNGGNTYIFQSPKAIDEYEAVRLMEQTKKEIDEDI